MACSRICIFSRYSYCRPYKKTSINIMDSILLTHLATICYVASSNHKSWIYLQFIQTVIAFPFAMFCLKIAYRIVRGISKVHFLNQQMSLRFCKSSQTRANSSLTTISDKQQIVSGQSKATYGTIISDLRSLNQGLIIWTFIQLSHYSKIIITKEILATLLIIIELTWTLLLINVFASIY